MNSPLAVHEGHIALACQTPTCWNSPARPVGSEPGLGSSLEDGPDTETHTHFGASGQEVARPQLVSRSWSQASLANHLFGSWQAISHKY